MHASVQHVPEPNLSKTRIADTTYIRRRLDVRGRVQGVGFRPFVYRLAVELRLAGLVGNDAHGAFIEIEGPAERISAFAARLTGELPPLARISALTSADLPLRHDTEFRIDTSRRGSGQDAEIAPDMAVCPDCLAELLNPRDRRYGYAFINCMNCGPRYSIIRGVPYDRANTTMAAFVMCPTCQAEYDDPTNRRFHAQPNACPVCGPRLWLADTDGHELAAADAAVADAAARLQAGKILAIKGIGGFHLACRADVQDVVERLRARKGREAKAFAVMVNALADAQALAEVDTASAAALTAPARPIVLLPKRDRQRIAESVAPGSDYYGLMLPYTPLHHLLFAAGVGPLVMTSANPSEEPLCRDNDEALARLARIADAFLLNDRDIERRVDDSVVLAVGTSPACRGDVCHGSVSRGTAKGVTVASASATADTAVAHTGGAQLESALSRADAWHGTVLPVRRARGLAPAPIQVPVDAPEPVLAVGGELKSTVCLLAGQQAVVSEHLGELANAAAYRNFVQTIDRFKALLRLEPRAVAYDLHPEYSATRHARTLGMTEIGVQHHHAHVVSCMADNGVSGPVIGVACDGTGYGTDGAIWGCEILVGDEAEFVRAGYLDYFPLPGGDAAAQDTWRPAVGLLRATFGAEWQREAAFCLRQVEAQAVRLTDARLASGARVPMTSSLGRLFDAAAFVLGVCDRNRYEAEAAMRLEALARRSVAGELLPLTIADPMLAGETIGKGGAGGDRTPLNPPLLRGDGAVEALRSGQPLRAGEVPRSGELHWQGDALRLDVRPLVRALVERARAGEDTGVLARAFHESIAALLVDAVKCVSARTGLNRVALSGGCFANRLLLEAVSGGLAAAGLAVFTHERVPTGDGGIALGQAVVAAERLRRKA